MNPDATKNVITLTNPIGPSGLRHFGSFLGPGGIPQSFKDIPPGPPGGYRGDAINPRDWIQGAPPNPVALWNNPLGPIVSPIGSQPMKPVTKDPVVPTIVLVGAAATIGYFLFIRK